MRHSDAAINSSMSIAPPTRPRGMQRPTSFTALIPLSGFLLPLAPRLARADLAAVDLAAIAVSAQLNLHAAASTQEEPRWLNIHAVELRALRTATGTWAGASYAAFTRRETPTDCGLGHESRTLHGLSIENGPEGPSLADRRRGAPRSTGTKPRPHRRIDADSGRRSHELGQKCRR